MVFDLWLAVSDMSFWLMFLHQTLKVNINFRSSSALFCAEKLKAQHMLYANKSFRFLQCLFELLANENPSRNQSELAAIKTTVGRCYVLHFLSDLITMQNAENHVCRRIHQPGVITLLLNAHATAIIIHMIQAIIIHQLRRKSSV